jgi:hypothetical protein
MKLEIKGRVIEWTGSNLHIGYENDHSNHRIYIGNGKLAEVVIQTDLTYDGILNKLGLFRCFKEV